MHFLLYNYDLFHTALSRFDKSIKIKYRICRQSVRRSHWLHVFSLENSKTDTNLGCSMQPFLVLSPMSSLFFSKSYQTLVCELRGNSLHRQLILNLNQNLTQAASCAKMHNKKKITVRRCLRRTNDESRGNILFV